MYVIHPKSIIKTILKNSATSYHVLWGRSFLNIFYNHIPFSRAEFNGIFNYKALLLFPQTKSKIFKEFCLFLVYMMSQPAIIFSAVSHQSCKFPGSCTKCQHGIFYSVTSLLFVGIIQQT